MSHNPELPASLIYIKVVVLHLKYHGNSLLGRGEIQDIEKRLGERFQFAAFGKVSDWEENRQKGRVEGALRWVDFGARVCFWVVADREKLHFREFE